MEGGDLLTLEHPWSTHEIVAQDGIHLSPLANGAKTAIGATRWPKHQPKPQEEAQEELRRRGSTASGCNFIPSSGHLWRGLRAVWPSDRLPVCGRIPVQKDIAVMLGLGGKGLLWGPYTAKVLVEHLALRKPIPAALAADRLPQQAWRTHRIGG